MNAPLLVIINPSSGNGKGIRKWKKIKPLLIKEKVAFESIITTKPKDAYFFTIKTIKKGIRTIIVIGGDGSLNEVINGIMSQKHCPTKDITLGIIPNGTGNDFARTMKIPSDVLPLTDIIKKRKQKQIDIGRVMYKTGLKSENAFFINMLGFGFDVSVNKLAIKLAKKGHKGILTYLYSMIKTVISYKKRDVSIKIDGTTHSFPNTFSICIANGIFHGGGVRQAPNANPSDGLFHVSVIHTLKNISAFLNLPNFYSGKFIEKSFANELTGKSFELLSENNVEVELDGEILEYTPNKIDIVPNAINFLIP
jgi:YegS/Rv2252/BmrU family lipid kinase